MAIKTMTLDEINKSPKLSKERIEEIMAFDEKFDDPECPPLTPEQLAQMKPAHLIHPEWYTHKVKKVDVHIKIDIDILEALKAGGKGYQTRINEILRRAVMPQ